MAETPCSGGAAAEDRPGVAVHTATRHPLASIRTSTRPPFLLQIQGVPASGLTRSSSALLRRAGLTIAVPMASR